MAPQTATSITPGKPGITIRLDRGDSYFTAGSTLTGEVELHTVQNTKPDHIIIEFQGTEHVLTIAQDSNGKSFEHHGLATFLSVTQTLLYPQAGIVEKPGILTWPFRIEIPLNVSTENVVLVPKPEEWKHPSNLKLFPKTQHILRSKEAGNKTLELPPGTCCDSHTFIQYLIKVVGPKESSRSRAKSMIAYLPVKFSTTTSSVISTKAPVERFGKFQHTVYMKVALPGQKRWTLNKFGKVMRSLGVISTQSIPLRIEGTCPTQIQIGRPRPFPFVLTISRVESDINPESNEKLPYVDLPDEITLTNLKLFLHRRTAVCNYFGDDPKIATWTVPTPHRPVHQRLDFVSSLDEQSGEKVQTAKVDLGAILDLSIPAFLDARPPNDLIDNEKENPQSSLDEGSLVSDLSSMTWPSQFLESPTQPYSLTPTFRSLLMSHRYTMRWTFDLNYVSFEHPEASLQKCRVGPERPTVAKFGVNVEVLPPPTTKACHEADMASGS